MLTKKAKYALNALVYLSNNATENIPITAFKIAQDNDISQKFLESILIEMKKLVYSEACTVRVEDIIYEDLQMKFNWLKLFECSMELLALYPVLPTNF